MNDIAGLLQAIEAKYPELRPQNARLIEAGQFSRVLIIDEALVFRFPRSPHVSKEMKAEIPLLLALQERLPLPIPNPIYSDYDAAGELVFMGYPMLEGIALQRDVFQAIADAAIYAQLAQELAHFLKTIHSLEIPNLAPAESDKRQHWQQLYQDFREKLFPFMRPDAQKDLEENFESALNNSKLWDFEACLIHGDFGTGNILYADGHIRGIIDFSFCAYDDPAQDLGALLASYGHDFVELVLDHYPELRLALPRAEFIRSNYALIQALYALRDGNQDDFDDGMQAYI